MKSLLSNIIQSTAIILILTLSSCGSSVNPINADDCEKLQEVATAFVDAAVLYSQDPSPENCIDYRETGEEYIDLVKGCSLSFGPGLEDAENEISSLEC